ncbi:monooxygenase [Dankookia rubra]|uniref:Monooxygenase n=1 Tax=Dankookia rubra TaxID=1442381 RepID=A0A4R5QE88_9PROT|nr:FAD-dependent monooxygenase [Dankookia rubra]TDH60979.1 monooxygenase [Dankookia rubra]
MTKPVLVAGAGPVGLTLACELARYGIPVRVVDKAAARTDKSKALVLWSRTLELLDRGGEAGAAPFVVAGFKAEAVNFVAGNRMIGQVGMGDVRSPYPYGLMLPQSETERLLEERLSREGVAIERRVELASFTVRRDGVEVVLRHAVDGREEVVSADWLIGCDGAHSTVRHGLNAPFAGETLDADWVLADIHMHGYPFPDSEAAVHWHHDGVLIIFPISPGRYRVIADLPSSGAEHPHAATLDQVQALIDRRGPPGLVAYDPIWLASFRINGRKVGSYRWGRAFLAGDAAHIHSPAGGQGMNTGMQDAFNLAWKLALVIRGTCGERLLDSYSSERSAVGDEVLKAAGRLTAVGTLRNPIAQAVRNIAGQVLLGLTDVRHAVADTMTEVSIGYPDSPLNGSGLRGGPAPGGRVVPVAGCAPVGSGSAPRFALFAEPTVATADLLRRFDGLLDPEVRPGFRDGAIWLVRPDGYAACAAEDPATIAGYLERL